MYYQSPRRKSEQSLSTIRANSRESDPHIYYAFNMSCNSQEDDGTSRECVESSESVMTVPGVAKQKQLIISNQSGTAAVEVNDCPVLNTQDSGKGSSEEGDGLPVGDDIVKGDGLVESNVVESDQQEKGVEFTGDEVGGEDTVDGYFLENEATVVLRKYFPILVTYLSQNVFHVAVELHSKGFLEHRTRNAACEVNGLDSETKAHMILRQLELRFSRNPATLVDCVYVLRECLPSITDLTQDILDEYNTAQRNNTSTEPNQHENPTPQLSDDLEKQTFGIASTNDHEENQPSQDFYDSSATGNEVHSLQQLFSLGEDDVYMLTQRLTKVLRSLSLTQETKVRDTNRKLFLTQQEVLELQQQVRECEKEKRLCESEVKQLKWLVEDTRRKNQLLNEDVVRYHLELEKCKKACEQKAVSTEPTYCGPDCEYYTKYLKSEKECVKHKAEIENLNERVAICVRLNSNDSN